MKENPVKKHNAYYNNNKDTFVYKWLILYMWLLVSQYDTATGGAKLWNPIFAVLVRRREN